MQSLQMRWPVPATIGLSTAIIAERADRHRPALEQVEFGDALFQRTARERHAEGALLVDDRLRRVLRFFLQPVGTGVLLLRVALDAVVRLVQRPGQIEARIGEAEAFAAPQVRRMMPRRDAVPRLASAGMRCSIDLARRLEQHAGLVPRGPPAYHRPGAVTQGEVKSAREPARREPIRSS